uniref:phospholipase D family nuclease n=1 Tax=Sulfuriferula sp. GW6 TaxID=3345112 RepID=UPI0039F6B5AD
MLIAGLAQPAFGRESLLADAFHAIESRPRETPTGAQVEVAFSPRAGATELVVKAISSAKKSILVAAYSFTSKPIAQALVAAHKRGVDVQVIVDKSQKSERYTSASFLANMGVPTRVDSKHKIMHDKFLVVDGQHVETGSFNFTSSAEQGNAENALVEWNNPKLAAIYAANWREHWDHSEPYGARY